MNDLVELPPPHRAHCTKRGRFWKVRRHRWVEIWAGRNEPQARRGIRKRGQGEGTWRNLQLQIVSSCNKPLLEGSSVPLVC